MFNKREAVNAPTLAQIRHAMRQRRFVMLAQIRRLVHIRHVSADPSGKRLCELGDYVNEQQQWPFIQSHSKRLFFKLGFDRQHFFLAFHENALKQQKM